MTLIKIIPLFFSLTLSIILYAEPQKTKEVMDPDLQYILRIPFDWDVDESFNLSDRRCIIYTDKNTAITVNARLTRYIESKEGLNNIINELVVFSNFISENQIRGLDGKIRRYNGPRGNSFMVAYIQNEVYTLFIVESGIRVVESDFYLPILVENATFYNSKSSSISWYAIGFVLLISISVLSFSILKKKRRRQINL